MEYKIEMAIHVDDLELLVNERIKEGWQPVGGISVTTAPPSDLYGNQTRFSQALIRYKTSVTYTANIVPLNEMSYITIGQN